MIPPPAVPSRGERAVRVSSYAPPTPRQGGPAVTREGEKRAPENLAQQKSTPRMLSPSRSSPVIDDTYRLQSAVGSLYEGLYRSGLPLPTRAEQLLRLLAELETAKAAPRRSKGGMTSRFFQVVGASSRPPVDAVDKVYEELEALSRVVTALSATESELQLALDFVAGTQARPRAALGSFLARPERSLPSRGRAAPYASSKMQLLICT